jgi:hypothetical protein
MKDTALTAGLAMQMRFRLARLAEQHGVTPALPPLLSLAPQSDRPVIVEGIAAHAGSIDSDRQRFRPYSLALRRPLPPLLFRHDPKQVAGTVDELSHDSDGNLRIRATVDHEMAKRCPAFSVAAKITAYELRDEHTPNFHALITAAEITEISLTPAPANSNALVLHRYPQFAGVAFHDHAIAGFKKAVEILKVLQQHLDAPPRAPAAVISHRPTQFQSLVQAMNRANP